MKCPKKAVLGALALALGIAALGMWSDPPARAQETPRAGGELAYSVLAEPPSFDAHQEATFAVPHSTAPFYSLLVKFDPFEYPKIVPDVAESWTISPDGKVYEFKLRDGVKFHDGSVADVPGRQGEPGPRHLPADRRDQPAEGRLRAGRGGGGAQSPHDPGDGSSARQPGMLTFLASPWNYIYKADLLEKDPHWFKKNVMGTGPFKLAEYVPGSHVLGKKNPDYFVKGLPVPRRVPGPVHHRRRRAGGRAPGRPGRRGLGGRHADRWTRPA